VDLDGEFKPARSRWRDHQPQPAGPCRSTAGAATGQNSGAAALDGERATFWHTRYSGTVAPLPHHFIVTSRAQRGIGGFKYLPRPAATGLNGTIAQYNSTSATTA